VAADGFALHDPKTEVLHVQKLLDNKKKTKLETRVACQSRMQGCIEVALVITKVA